MWGRKSLIYTLFGQPAVEPPTTPTDTKNLQTSQLAFKLAGVVSGEAGQIVIEDGGKQSNYRVGEDIAAGCACRRYSRIIL